MWQNKSQVRTYKSNIYKSHLSNTFGISLNFSFVSTVVRFCPFLSVCRCLESFSNGPWAFFISPSLGILPLWCSLLLACVFFGPIYHFFRVYVMDNGFYVFLLLSFISWHFLFSWFLLRFFFSIHRFCLCFTFITVSLSLRLIWFSEAILKIHLNATLNNLLYAYVF